LIFEIKKDFNKEFDDLVHQRIKKEEKILEINMNITETFE
jgi:hypothetical protein